MSRMGTVPGLASPRPLVAALPALYQEDDFTSRFTSAFDAALAPVFLALDSFPAYLDPALTPDDFLDWLGGWVGLLLDETWPIERRRAFIAVAGNLYRRRGTAGGLAALVRLFTSGEVQIVESGGAAWSPTTGGALPGSPDFGVLVRVLVPQGVTIDPVKLDALVAAAKPAHVLHRVEVVAS